MVSSRIVEYVFFFGLMAIVGYLVWEMFQPFVSALALSAIIVTVSYPLYERIRERVPKKNEFLAALLATILVFVIVFAPFIFITSALVNEAVSVYRVLDGEQIGFETSLQNFEDSASRFVPSFELNITEYAQQGAEFLAANLGAIFASTASTVFLVFISMIGTYYLFKDGRLFTRRLIEISPLPDDQDDLILDRLARSLRSVLTGRILVAIIQGVLTAVGLWLFGFERAVLWGVVASFGALIPSVGTSIIFIPAVIYLLFSGAYGAAVGLSVWGMVAVGLIDNILGPYLMSRGNAMHPFIILLAVLGGIAFFGPIGFIVGPVVVSLFMVLLELYSLHIADPQTSTDT